MGNAEQNSECQELQLWNNGKQCEEVLAAFNIDIAFITVNALSYEHGLTDFRVHEVGVIKTILSRTKYKVVVADSSKFETSSYINICSLKDIDLIVTDNSIPSHIAEKYNNHNIRVLFQSEGTR